MARRAAPADRERVEAALTPEDLSHLDRACVLLSLSRTGWHLCERFARPYLAIAVQREAHRLQAERGCSAADAVEAAAVRLGVQPATAVGWLREFPLETWGARPRRPARRTGNRKPQRHLRAI